MIYLTKTDPARNLARRAIRRSAWKEGINLVLARYGKKPIA